MILRGDASWAGWDFSLICFSRFLELQTKLHLDFTILRMQRPYGTDSLISNIFLMPPVIVS